jgi:hypothetical protein
MKRLLALTACVIAVAATAGQAKAAGGFLVTYNPCPLSQPYQHVTVYGTVFCSIYP